MEDDPLLHEEEESDEDVQSQLQYAIDAFHAVAFPVSATIFFSCLVVNNISLDSGSADSSNSFTVYSIGATEAQGQESDTRTLVKESMVNALVIVAVVACVTFVIVLLYKYRCMSILKGYMMCSSMLLLMVMGGILFEGVLNLFGAPFDILSFVVLLWNGAVSGVISIWYPEAVPHWVTSCCLVFVSVCMAWSLSRIDDWTSWALLACLALYDLCAVLSPCGPLRALVHLMQDYGEPMPGLLFEARMEDTDDMPRGSSSVSENEALSSQSRHRNEMPSKENIKLGLGDFVFYSLLVSKASKISLLHGFTAYIGVMTGLALTLVVLSLYKMALPALPISIGLGIMMFATTTYSIDPLLTSALREGLVI